MTCAWLCMLSQRNILLLTGIQTNYKNIKVALICKSGIKLYIFFSYVYCNSTTNDRNKCTNEKLYNKHPNRVSVCVSEQTVGKRQQKGQMIQRAAHKKDYKNV